MIFEQYEEECDNYFDNYFDNFDAAKVIPIPPGMFDMFDTDDEFTTITTTIRTISVKNGLDSKTIP